MAHDPTDVTRFAGLTRHNRVDMSDRAASIAGMSADSPPETSLAQAIRALEEATTTGALWEVPQDAAQHLDVDAFNEEAPEGTEAVELGDSGVAVRTHRFQSVISPDKLRDHVSGSFTDDDDSFQDPLWHNPTENYSIINPGPAYEHLEEAIRDEDLGDEVFGEIREYRDGGQVHMDILFDAYQIDYQDDDQGRDPIVLGIRTGYDFFGDTTLYFEGFGQDTRCSNSIRAVTEKEVIRHTGDGLDERIEEAVDSVMEGLGLMTDRLAELIEMAEDIELELLDLNLAEPMTHDDHLQAFYELAGFPTYMARGAASHARTRAENQFMPDMTDVWDGATYALTHEFRGGEDTSRARELVQTAGDMVQNPSQVISQVEREHRTRMATSEGSEQQTLESESAHAAIEQFSESVQQKAEKFESTQDELRQTLVAEAGDGDDAEA